MNACRRLHGRAHGCNAGAVPGRARHMAPLGPAAIAVHDDGDVPGQARGIEMAVKFRFFLVEPGGYLYFVMQSGHANMRLTQQGRGCNDGKGSLPESAESFGISLISVASKDSVIRRLCLKDEIEQHGDVDIDGFRWKPREWHVPPPPGDNDPIEDALKSLTKGKR